MFFLLLLQNYVLFAHTSNYLLTNKTILLPHFALFESNCERLDTITASRCTCLSGGRMWETENCPGLLLLSANTWDRVASWPRWECAAVSVLGYTGIFNIVPEELPWLMRRYGFRRRCLVPHAAVTACAPCAKVCERRHGHTRPEYS